LYREGGEQGEEKRRKDNMRAEGSLYEAENTEVREQEAATRGLGGRRNSKNALRSTALKHKELLKKERKSALT